MAGGEKGEHGERGVRGYRQGLRLAKPMSAYNSKVRCRQVQFPKAKVRTGFNYVELGVKVLTATFSG